MTFTIETTIALPDFFFDDEPDASEILTDERFPFSFMQVGDSIRFPTEGELADVNDRELFWFHSAMNLYEMYSGQSFKYMMMEDSYLRIWRVA